MMIWWWYDDNDMLRTKTKDQGPRTKDQGPIWTFSGPEWASYKSCEALVKSTPIQNFMFYWSSQVPGSIYRVKIGFIRGQRSDFRSIFWKFWDFFDLKISFCRVFYAKKHWRNEKATGLKKQPLITKNQNYKNVKKLISLYRSGVHPGPPGTS